MIDEALEQFCEQHGDFVHDERSGLYLFEDGSRWNVHSPFERGVPEDEIDRLTFRIRFAEITRKRSILEIEELRFGHDRHAGREPFDAEKAELRILQLENLVERMAKRSIRLEKQKEELRAERRPIGRIA